MGFIVLLWSLVALTVVDPHDQTKRAIPAYFIEGCYLRALRTQESEPAFDSSFPTGSLSPTGMEKVEAALIASNFDFSPASLDTRSIQATNLASLPEYDADAFYAAVENKAATR